MKQRIQLFILLILAGFLSSGCGYNTMVSKEEAITVAWMDVENAYQRRANIAMELAETAKAYEDNDSAAMNKLADAWEKTGAVNSIADSLTTANLLQFELAQTALDEALINFIIANKSYPDLNYDNEYRKGINQLYTANIKITQSRKVFNEAVKDYNTFIRKFPRSIWHTLLGFEKKDFIHKTEPEN